MIITYARTKGSNVTNIDTLVHEALGGYADKLEEFVHLIDTGRMDNSQSIKKKEKELSRYTEEVKRVKQGFKVGIYGEDEALEELERLVDNIERVQGDIDELKSSQGFSEKEYVEEQLNRLKRFLTHGDTMSEKEMNVILSDFIEIILYKKVDKEVELDIVYKDLV